MTNMISSTIQITASKSKVWGILANLEALQEYDVFVAKSFYVSDVRTGVGASRQCDLPDGTYIRERVIDWRDGEGYTIDVYEDGTQAPIAEQKVDFTLAATDNGTAVHMTYQYDLTPGDAVEPQEFEQGAQALITGVLAGLKQFSETGVPVVTEN